MKKVAKGFYKASSILAIIGIVISIIVFILGIVCLTNTNDVLKEAIKNSVDNLNSKGEVRAAGVALILAGIFGVGLRAFLILLFKKARKSIDETPKESKIHVIVLVISIFTSLFYTLTSILGLVSTMDAQKAE